MNDKLKNGATIIFVSHNLPAVAALCPKTLVLHRGETEFLGSSREGIERYMELSDNKKDEHTDASISLTHASWNASGNDLIRPGDTFELKIGLRFLQQVAHPTFVLMFGRIKDSLDIYQAEAQQLGVSPRIYEKGEEILLSFKGKINLLRGLYDVGFKIVLSGQDTAIFRINTIHKFYVHETASLLGMVDFSCTASESRLEGSIIPQGQDSAVSI